MAYKAVHSAQVCLKKKPSCDIDGIFQIWGAKMWLNGRNSVKIMLRNYIYLVV